MLVGIVTNLGLLALGALVLHFIAMNNGRSELSKRHKVVIGVCFGVLSMVVVEFPVQAPGGATFDTRAAPAVLAGFYAGPIGGVICAAIAGAARFHVGGPVVIGGSLSPLVYALVGVFAGYLFDTLLKRRPGVFDFLGLSAFATMCVVPLFFVDQGLAFGFSVLNKAWHVFLVSNIAGILILGLVSEQIRKTLTGYDETARALFTSDLARASAKIAVWRYDFATDRLQWDPAMYELYGCAPEEFKGTYSDWASRVYEHDLDLASHALDVARETNSPFEYRFRIVLKDGTHKWVQAHGKFLPATEGQPTEVIGVNWDITKEVRLNDDLKRREHEARERSQELEITFSSMKQGVSVFGGDGTLFYANRRVSEILGLTDEDLAFGTSFEYLLAQHKANGNFAGDPGRGAARVQKIMQAGKVIRTKAKLQTGRVVVYTLTPKPNGGWVETVEDITENAAAEARIMSAAETDALTGLGNRLAFNKILDRVVRGASYGSRGYSLILVDLNNFKSLNDTYGHHIGDRVLQETAHVLKQTCRAEDFAARLGGDEFAVIIKSPQPGSVEYLARRLSKQFARPMCIGDLNLQSGAAIGIAPIEPGSSAEEVLVNADAAMYKAKSENLNQYKVFDNIIAAELRGMRRLQAELATVIGEEKLETHFQPVIDLESGELSGAEALVRWRKGDGSFVTPATFVPLAEDVGMIREIGSQVLWASIRAAAGWPDHMTVSVNVSPKQLGTGEFLNQVLECLREHNLDAKRLELEVTENVLMDKESAALAELLEFKKHGVRIALDDFGTGYSSLSYLHHFSFDKLKIDRAFVMPMERDQTCAALVYTILNLCQNLGLDCTAEGIETEHQRRLLTVAGCNYGQGYQFYRPMPETEFNQIISEAYPLFAKNAIAVGQV